MSRKRKRILGKANVKAFIQNLPEGASKEEVDAMIRASAVALEEMFCTGTHYNIKTGQVSDENIFDGTKEGDALAGMSEYERKYVLLAAVLHSWLCMQGKMLSAREFSELFNPLLDTIGEVFLHARCIKIDKDKEDENMKEIRTVAKELRELGTDRDECTTSDILSALKDVGKRMIH